MQSTPGARSIIDTHERSGPRAAASRLGVQPLLQSWIVFRLCMTRLLALMLALRVMNSDVAYAQAAVSLARDAQRAYELADYATATRLLLNAKAENPSWPEIEFNLGVTAEAAREYESAIAYYRSYASQLPPDSAREVNTHAAALETYQRQLKESESGGGLPWWAWTLIIIGGLAVIGAAAEQSENAEE